MVNCFLCEYFKRTDKNHEEKIWCTFHIIPLELSEKEAKTEDCSDYKKRRPFLDYIV